MKTATGMNMKNDEALNWLAARAADAPVTIRTATMDRAVYQEAVETLAGALRELELHRERQAAVARRRQMTHTAEPPSNGRAA